ncbi:hypothetical protein GH714_038690 [Hevea brasiliensis]|uniref:Cell growth-regulating nucleolar protein-like winged helix domain-containing protein n=1 Tax=Hevea brasiliensis TaxID=3981 RepID=A0A6A6L9B4_HEVBR|nr:hypothetical protein GH714_038690 [Hevea brasiliensis]
MVRLLNPKNTKQQPDIDINIGLSQHPPWFCCLCNTKATSKQTLLLHGDGKKHRAKARAFHAAKLQQTRQTESAQDKTAMNGTPQMNPDGVLKMKKLKKLVLKSLQESGITEGETQSVECLSKRSIQVPGSVLMAICQAGGKRLKYEQFDCVEDICLLIASSNCMELDVRFVLDKQFWGPFVACAII